MSDRMGLLLVLVMGCTLAGDAAGSEVAGVSSVAVTDDASALFTNPAALCRSIPNGAYFSWDHSEDNRLRIGSGAFAHRGFGLGYEVVQPQEPERLHRWSVGFGNARPDRPLSFGVRGTHESQQLDRRDSAWRWDFGMLWRPGTRLSLGWVAQDLNEGRFFGEAHETRSTIGIGLRPLPGDLRQRLTLHADATGPHEGRWKDEASLRAGLWASIAEGVAVGGAVDGPLDGFSDERRISVGFRIDALHASILSNLHLDRDDEVARAVHAVSFTGARQPTFLKERTVTKVELSGAYGDAKQHELPLPIIGHDGHGSVRPILQGLENARKDPHVRGVLVEIEGVKAGALTDEIRDEILRVREAGKPVVAFARDLENRGSYYIASACDRIVLDEMGGISGLGFRFDIPYMGEMLDSVGVRMEKVARGKYKTAYEPLVESRPTEGMIESVNSVLDDMMEFQAERIAEGRKIDRASLDDLLSGKWWSPQEALQAGWVDSIGDVKSAKRILARLAGMKGEPSPQFASGWEYVEERWLTGRKVAILWLDGPIHPGKSGGGIFSENSIGSETVVEQIRALARRSDVAAVVLRIDSPGGSALASDEIWRATEELKRKKPVVASMSRVAGSGGYYIACNANRIVAEPGTITGSIGVLTMKPDLSGFYDRRRIHVATFQRGDWMGLSSTAHRWTPEERKHMQGVIDHYYEKFLARVQAGRGLAREAIDAVGQGRIWTGRQAKQLGLIDETGGLREALAIAREAAGLPADAETVSIDRPGGFWLSFGGAGARLEDLLGRAGRGEVRYEDPILMEISGAQ